jgi:hypothetical protein
MRSRHLVLAPEGQEVVAASATLDSMLHVRVTSPADVARGAGVLSLTSARHDASVEPARRQSCMLTAMKLSTAQAR